MTSPEDTMVHNEINALLGDLPAAGGLSAERQGARQRHLEGELTKPVSGRNRRRLAVIGAAAGVGVLLAAASAVYVARAPATDATYARCFTAASLDADAVGTDTSMAFAPGEAQVPNAPAHALEMCAAWWNLQLTGEASYAGGSDGQNRDPVPDLVACVLKNGAVGVFPGDERTCVELGLPRLQTD